MSQLFDFIPILVFALVFFTTDIYLATAALIVAVGVQLAVYKLTGRRIGKELWLTFWASLIFGGLTLLLRDETFIQWKPTIVNWAFALALVGAKALGGRNLLQSLLGEQLTLPDSVWSTLNYGWAAGFTFAGILNLIVAYNFSMEFWVSYKLIGGFALTFCYIIITMVYLSRGGYLDELEAAANTPDNAATDKESKVEQGG